MITGLLIWILVFEIILSVLLLALVVGVYQFMKQEAGWQGERLDPDEYVRPATLDELSHPFWQGTNKQEEADKVREAAQGSYGGSNNALVALSTPFDEEEFLHRHEKIKKDIAKIELPGELL